MLPVARITDGDSNNGRSPVANESLSTCVENGLTANSFCASAVNLDTLVWFIEGVSNNTHEFIIV